MILSRQHSIIMKPKRRESARKRVVGLLGEDRISVLPDAVLGHILSYLPTKQSVSTSILSKRWLSVWSCVPVLDLDDSLLSSPLADTDLAIHTTFVNFVNNVLNLHKTDCLRKLALKCHKFDTFRVNEWVMAAVKRRVIELDLCISVDERVLLGPPLFVYQDLVALKLGKKFVLHLPADVSLPCLKKLHLDSICFSDDESCRKLLSGCPAVEDLCIERCGMQNVKTLQVTAPALKFLMIIDWDDANKAGYQIVVDAPDLQVLHCESYLAKGYCFKNLDSLSEAYIDANPKHVDRSKSNHIRETALQIVTGIVHAKIITFTGFTLEVLCFLDLGTLPIFNELTKLVMGGNVYCGKLLPKFLDNSPILQSLVLDEGIARSGSLGDFVWKPYGYGAPRCFLKHLKSVSIWGFKGQGDVLSFMKFLIHNGKVLDVLSAAKRESEHRELKVSSQLLEHLPGTYQHRYY